MKEFIIENMEIIITIITAIVTYVLGVIAKRSVRISDNLIPLQNIIIMVIAFVIYYFAIGEVSLVIASGSPVATLIYDVFNNLKKED